MNHAPITPDYATAAAYLADAEALLIGAGMGVDSGLPAYRLSALQCGLIRPNPCPPRRRTPR
jgi:hypothetical protein